MDNMLVDENAVEIESDIKVKTDMEYTLDDDEEPSATELDNLAMPDSLNAAGKGKETTATRRHATARARRRAKRRYASIDAFVGDSEGMYLKRIGEIQLLTAAEEVRLARKIEAGTAATAKLERAESECIELDRRERVRLTRVAQIGMDAKQQMIEANLRLVVSIAKRYKNRDMPMADLIQEGSIGLTRAVEKFDWRKGFKFSTYATWWIRQAITRAIADQSRIVRIPVHMHETVNKLKRIEDMLIQELGREPTDEEIGAKMGLTANRVREIQKMSQQPVSLDTPIGEDEDSQLGDFIPDVSATSPSDAAEFALLQDAIREVLSDLSDERERKIISMRVGLEDGQPRTLEYIGNVFGVTRERVRQIQEHALKKLKQPSMARRLEGFLP